MNWSRSLESINRRIRSRFTAGRPLLTDDWIPPRIGELDAVIAIHNLAVHRLILLVGASEQRRRRVERDLQRRVAEREILYAISRALISEHELPALLNTILASLVGVTGATRAAILLLSSDSRRLTVEAAHQIPVDAWPRLGMAMSAELLCWTPLTAEWSMRGDPLRPSREVVSGPPSDAVSFCFPVRGHLRDLGSIFLVFAAGSPPPSSERRRLIEVLAGSAALAIERARLAEDAAASAASRQADQLKDEFLAALSHDLRNPLTYIRGAAELLSFRDFKPPERLEILREMVSQAEQMTAMVEDLLQYSQIAAGHLRLQRTAVDLVSLLQRAARRFGPQSSAHRIVVEAPPDAPLLWADERHLERILNNLVVNAIRYSPGGGTVTLRACVAAEQVEVAVVDEGIGIAAEEIPHLFERFYRGHQVQGSPLHGTGLGLAIVAELVRAHGGVIAVESVVGKGSTFRVRMPRAWVTTVA